MDNMESNSCTTKNDVDCQVLHVETDEADVQLAPEFSKRLSLGDDSKDDKINSPMSQNITGLAHSNKNSDQAKKGSADSVMSSPYASLEQLSLSKGSRAALEGSGLSPTVVFSEKAPICDELDSLEATSASTVRVTPDPANEPDLAECSQFVCQCGESFDKSVQLAAHRRWSCKLKEKKAQCDECKTWFASEQGLRRHMRHVHGGTSKCDACGLRLKNNIQLTRHWLDAHHEDGKECRGPLKCYVCGNTGFTDKYELECHWLRHKYDQRQKRLGVGFGATNSSSKLSPPAPSAVPEGVSTTNASQPGAQVPPHNPHQIPPHAPHTQPPYWHMPPPPPPPPHFHPLPHFHPPPHFPPPPPPPPPPPHMFMGPHSYMQTYYPGQHTSQTTQATPPMSSSSHAPRHDHTYIEPTSRPRCYYPGFRQGGHFAHRGKLKWKKYLKLMMKGLVPPLWSGGMLHHPMSGFFQGWGSHPPHECDNAATADDKNDGSNSEFQIACKFCDKVIKREWITWHQRKECPVLTIHKCCVCDRVFRKRHMLLRHMHEQNHHKFSATRSSNAHSEVNSATLSCLQKKMNDALNFTQGDEADENVAAEMPEPMNTNVSSMDPEATDSRPDIQQPHTAAETDKALDQDRGAAARSIRCCVCMASFPSEGFLRGHLREHLDQVETIQKVRDWTISSADYFHLAGNSDGGSEADQETVSVADSEITSTTGSVVTAASSAFSGLTQASTSTDNTWTKPHKKVGSHHNSHRRHRKGEISVCDFCGDQFAFHKDLETHIKKKHPDSKLRCPVCQKSFSWKKRGKFYERHMESHYGVKIFKHKCEHCDKTFLEKSKLVAHVAALHTQELQHKCATCGKSYANKSSLVRHERKHTGARPYSCPVCAETFLEKRELLRHSATHTGVAPFRCEECGQGFTLKTSLTTHKKNKHAISKDK